jgi:hypothetical protein
MAEKQGLGAKHTVRNLHLRMRKWRRFVLETVAALKYFP